MYILLFSVAVLINFLKFYWGWNFVILLEGFCEFYLVHEINYLIFYVRFVYVNFLLQVMFRRRMIQRHRPWKLLKQWSQALPLRRRQRRSGQLLLSIGLRLCQRIGTLSTLALVLPQGISLIIIRFWSFHSQPSLQWRRSKTTTLWFSLLTCVPTKRKSRMPWRKCMTSRPRKLTPWSGELSLMHWFFLLIVWYLMIAFGWLIIVVLVILYTNYAICCFLWPICYHCCDKWTCQLWSDMFTIMCYNPMQM